MTAVHTIIRLARRTLDVALLALILLVLATVAIARLIPMLTGGATFVVGGGSMEPTIPLGAVVIALPVGPGDLAVGDVVSVQVGEQKTVFTHRIIRIASVDGETWLETKGDANHAPDPSIIPVTAVIGEVGATIPVAGYAVRLLSTAQGVVFLLALGVLVLAAAWLLESLELDRRAVRRTIAPARARSSVDTPTGEAAAG